MTKKYKLPILLILILALTVSVLVACGSVEIASVRVKEGSVYKTEYVIGEEFDLTGIELLVARTDKEIYDVMLTDVRQDVKIMNFRSDVPNDELSVIIDYKGFTTSIIISVKAVEDATTKYVVSFDTGHGSEVPSVGANEFETIANPGDPTRPGYAFDGWYKQPTYNDVWNFDVDKVVADTVLYAKWSKLYTFTFRNTYAGVADVVKYVKAGDTLSDIPAVQKIEGMTGRWDRESFIAVDNIVVEAVYEVSLFEVNFYYMDADGITPVLLKTFTDVPYGSDLTDPNGPYAAEVAAIKVPQYNYDGTKHFDSWNTPFTNIVADLNIFALYAPNSYSVNFDLNDGSGNLFHVTENIPYNNPVSALDSEPTREGYEFGGWYKQKEGLTPWNFNTDRVSAETTLYAKWIKLYYIRFLVSSDVILDEEITETFVVDEGGTPVEYKLFREIAVKEGGNVNKPQTPAKTGFTASWVIEDTALQNISQNLIVKAQFDINYYTVNFYNYDRTLLATSRVAYNTPAVAPQTLPTRYGYTFSKWDTDFSAVLGDLDVTATFEASEYSVNIVPNNGTSNFTVKTKFDSRVVLPSSVVYNGYHFDGWFTDSIYSADKQWDIANDTLNEVGEGALTLYAKWRKIHTVLFLDADEVEVDKMSIIDGEYVEEIPSIASRTGYTGAWYKRNTVDGTLENNAFNFEDAVSSDLILVTQYIINVYTVTFFRQAGDIHLRLEVRHGERISTEIGEPVLEGKIFVDWGVSGNPEDLIIESDMNFLARFTPVVYQVTWAVSQWGLASDVVSSVEHGKPAVYPMNEKAPVRVGYSLKGWVAQGSSADINNIVSDATFAPVWEINSYSIEFKDKETNAIYDQNDGNVLVQSQRREHGRFFDVDGAVANPTKVGKEFTGWQIGDRTFKYDVDLGAWILENQNVTNSDVYAFGGSTVSLVVRENTLYYTYEALDSVMDYLINWNNSKILPLTETASGWEGNGLPLSSAKTIVFKGHIFYEITADTTFLSTFVDSTYTVSYVSDMEIAGLTDANYVYGKPSVAPSVPSIANYVFIGWYLEDTFVNKYSFGVPVTEDLILYARWDEANDYTKDGVVYTLNETGEAYSLTAVESSLAGQVTVANYFNGKPVDSIGAEAFAGNAYVTSVIIPDTVVNVGPGAFMNMAALTSISLPESITIIPDNAFSGCQNLQVVDFGTNSHVTTIGKNAFAKNTSLKYSALANASIGVYENVPFKLPESLEVIDNGAFYNAIGITELTIPQNVITIGDNAFAGAVNLRYVIFTKNAAANIGTNVFQNYTALQNAFRIYVPNIANYNRAASDDTNNWKQWSGKIYGLDNIIYDDYTTKTSPLWSYTRDANSELVLLQYLGNATTVVVSDILGTSATQTAAVATIGNYAFDSNTLAVEFSARIGLEEFTFDSAENLESLTIRADTTIELSASYLYGAYTKLPKLNTLVVSPTITVSELFGGAAPTSLTKVKTLSGNVTANFLANCVYVQEVEIDSLTQVIGENAFLNCTALREVKFNKYYNVNSSKYEERLVTIGSSAFSGAISLSSFKVVEGETETDGILNSVSTIGENAFDGTEWILHNENALIIVGNGILYRYNALASDASSLVVIPSSVTSITASAFSGVTSIKHVYVEDLTTSKLTSIGNYAFANCVNLETVVLPQTLTEIGLEAFSGNSKLSTFVILATKAPTLYSNTFENTGIIKVYAPKTSVEENRYIGYWPDALEGVENGQVIDDGNVRWVVSSVTNGLKLIKVITAESVIEVPGTLNRVQIMEIADYALPRGIESLKLSLNAQTLTDKAFQGVTTLRELTLFNEFPDKGVTSNALKVLLDNNTSVDTISMLAKYSVLDLIGSKLPNHIKTVNILSGTEIASGFLENNDGVEFINVTLSDGTLVKLEETASTLTHEFATIGAKAFRNTKWMQDYDGEYIVVLGGNLVDYKGVNSILTIPENVTKINGSIFENDDFVEVVTIPETVTKIGENAFNGASKLTKVFLNGVDTVPSVETNSFDANGNVEIYVPDVNAYTGNWSGFNPISKDGVIHFTNKVLEYVSGNQKIVDYTEYILNENTRTLMLSRKYRETYIISGDTQTLVSLVESSVVEAPSAVLKKGEYSNVSYSISTLGNNVFMSSVKEVTLSMKTQISDKSFNNVGVLDKITFVDCEEDVISKEKLRNFIVNHSVATVAYDGSRALSNLLFGDGETVETTSLPISGVEILDGTTVTVDNLLAGWTGVERIKFPASIERVGINSLEDTAWFNNYTSSQYGNDFVVLGGLLLYKYKGISNAVVVIPSEVKIVNVGAFSTYADGEWSSKLGLNQIRFESGSSAHTIWDYAFAGCKLLASISLPTSMSNIAPTAFDNTAFYTVNDALIVSGTEQGATLVKYYGTEENYVLPSDVMYIASGAFAGNMSIKSFSYDTVNGTMLKNIRENAFNGAENLETINLPSSVAYIGKEAFHNTKWFGEQLNQSSANYRDVMIGSILYHAIPLESTYTVTVQVSSITEGAFDKVESFTAAGVTYPSDDYVPTNLVELFIDNGVVLPQLDLYKILSAGTFTALRTNGQIALRDLLGTDEPIEYITTLNFYNFAQEIAAGYAEGWSNVTTVGNVPATVTRIGENAFRGTTWFDNLSPTRTLVTAGDSKIIIKYNGTSSKLEIGTNSSSEIKGITADAFRGNETLEELYLGNYAFITEIPEGAFMDCVNLAKVTLNDRIETFGENAFYNTAWLNNYESDFLIIDGAMIAYKGTYTEENQGEITIPQETTMIYPYVFRGNLDITSVIFDENCLITAITGDMFAGCENLENITINEHILKVERSAIAGTKWLSIVSQSSTPVLTYENEYLGINRIVLYVGSGSSYRIPGDVTEIMSGAFQGVTSLVTLTFVDGKLKEIPANAFAGCSNLTNVVIVSSIENIGTDAFEGTKWLADQLNEFIIVNGTLVKYNGSSTEIVLPENVYAIEQGVFTNVLITSIDMSKTAITEIPENAFTGLINLETVLFSTATERIGSGAFNGTKFLDNVVDMLLVNGVALVAYKGASGVVAIPETVRYLNADVFQGNSALTGVEFSGDIEIEANAFVGTSLSSVSGADFITAIGENAFSGTTYELNQTVNYYTVIGGHLVSYTGAQTDIIIPSNVTYIPENVFNGTNITSVDFSLVEGALEIAPNAFRNAVNLQNVTFSDNIDYIGTRAFYNTAWYRNRNLSSEESLIITENGKLLAYIAESNTVSIPSRVTSFARDVFTGNVNISSLTFALGTAVDIPAKAFAGCTSLINISFPSVEFSIGEKAFDGTPWLRSQGNYVVVNGKLICYKGTSTDIVIPATVTSIYDYVFRGNETITSLAFASGSSLAQITGEAFKGCASLNSVTFSTALQKLEMSAFEGTAWRTNLTVDFVSVGSHLLAYIGTEKTAGEGIDVIIPASIETIAPTAFQGNLQIKSVDLEMGSFLTEIPAEAFKGCLNLVDVKFLEETSASEIDYVGKDAFADTQWLTDKSKSDSNLRLYKAFIFKNKMLFYTGTAKAFQMPNIGVTFIARSMFENTSVETVTIRDFDPATISLAEGAFDTVKRIVVDAEYAANLRLQAIWKDYHDRIAEYA